MVGNFATIVRQFYRNIADNFTGISRQYCRQCCWKKLPVYKVKCAITLGKHWIIVVLRSEHTLHLKEPPIMHIYSKYSKIVSFHCPTYNADNRKTFGYEYTSTWIDKWNMPLQTEWYNYTNYHWFIFTTKLLYMPSAVYIIESSTIWSFFDRAFWKHRISGHTANSRTDIADIPKIQPRVEPVSLIRSTN